MSRRLLMIAFHYPPYSGSSGSRRTIAFSRYLSRFGWDPIVLTVDPRAHERTSDRESAHVPAEVRIIRAFALDAARHFSIAGRYPARLAVPDRWRSWQWFGARAALGAIREFAPAAIWSTYPIASAHAIGAQVARRSGLPWVADMRDPMVELDPYTGIAYPTDPAVRRARLAIERQVMDHAARVVFCTRGSQRISAERYGADVARRFRVIANGYDEEVFAQAEAQLPPPAASRSGFRLVHSGTVYPGDDRGPGPLFSAIARMRDAGALPAGFRLVLRATGYDAQIGALARSCRVDDLVEIAASLSYGEALQEMLRADGLLLLQGAASNPAIPAKLYEYLRAQRPILALVHPDGDSAALLEELQAATLARLDDAASIAAVLPQFLAQCAAQRARIVSRAVAARYSRESQSGDLAQLLDELVVAPSR